ncbi:DUF1295 domain-containing protein [Amphibiibacter pelophylacis]|uniref:DUF1295 domain-containing protein n=1 Tax=Amphibiibacter pelophylacis TaxID=1799477 RepID=A0ACC6P108_9BURK
MSLLFAPWTLSLLVLALSFGGVWLWQLRSRNAGMVDPVWALSLGALALVHGVFQDGHPLARALVALGGGVWGLRLGLHLWRRNAGQPEDARYTRLRQEWGAQADLKMLGFFGVQAVVSLLLAMAFAIPAGRETAPGFAAVLLALILWGVAVGGEALADRQLRDFVAQPGSKGQVCRAGLWRYSRHPNYFFECLHWVAYIPLAAGTGWTAWLTLLPPVLMAWLLVKVSGLPMLEEHLARSRPGYAEYQRTTSALIPWWPKR